MLLWQALLLGLIQGVAELFPVSSLAQTILLPALFHWHVEQSHFWPLSLRCTWPPRRP